MAGATGLDAVLLDGKETMSVGTVGRPGVLRRPEAWSLLVALLPWVARPTLNRGLIRVPGLEPPLVLFLGAAVSVRSAHEHHAAWEIFDSSSALFCWSTP